MDIQDKSRLIEWLNSFLPDTISPISESDEELRALLADGTILCRLLSKLKPGSVTEFVGSDQSSDNVNRFLSAINEMGLSGFHQSDLEKGSMKMVWECLSKLRTNFMNDIAIGNKSGNGELFGIVNGSHSAPPKRRSNSDSKFQQALRSLVISEPSAALLHHIGHRYHEVFQRKHGGYSDLPPAKISEMMKPNSLDSLPTQSLLGIATGILDESIERKNGEIPYQMVCLLSKVVQEIERRISTQAEHLKTQNNLYKTREEKYQSRIKVLEALATGPTEETKIVMNQLQQIKSKLEDKMNDEDQDFIEMMKEKDKRIEEIEELKRLKEIEQKKRNDEIEEIKRNEEIEERKKNEEIEERKRTEEIEEKIRNEAIEEKKRIEEIEGQKRNEETELKKGNEVIAALKQELEIARKIYEQGCLNMETEAKGTQQELEQKLLEVSNLLIQSKNKVKELETICESRSQQWSKKKQNSHIFTEVQLGTLHELRFVSQSIRQEVVKTQRSFLEEIGTLGKKVEGMQEAARSYSILLAENRKLHNEVQELKGNIRVYCRIRPFYPGQKDKQSAIEYIGDNGELMVVNPSKPGKEGRRLFKFNKVYGLPATQAEVFQDIQPLIQSVLDGYNVCIFAYGQTGSGKTYTMIGPDGATEEQWGVNYRALNDLFRISQTRKSSFTYEIGAQMVEIYNETVRDLLSNDASQQRLGILSTSQPNGLAVPDASMFPVNSTSDVLELMDIGLNNRAKSSTAMNERSSRSHSVVTIHISGTDLKTGSTMRSSLHLVDLAGSERVDRSEVTGDRLKEAQYINKSLAALGDVIFALAQKSAHVPYRNSKLTQVLQSSLGGQAKTLMFVQLNPDVSSYSESISTLKFAERVSGVELGAAKTSKDGKDIRELMEQVASLKETMARKDEEIARLQVLKDVRPGVNGEKRVTSSLSRYGSLSSSTTRIRRSQKIMSSGKGLGLNEKEESDEDNYSDSLSSCSQYSIDHNFTAENDERLSDVTDSSVSVGTENDASIEGNVLVHEGEESSEKIDKQKKPSKISRTVSKSRKHSPETSNGFVKSNSGSNISLKSSSRWQ